MMWGFNFLLKSSRQKKSSCTCNLQWIFTSSCPLVAPPVHTSLTTSLILKASFLFRVNLKNKSSWDKIVWKSEKRFLLSFDMKIWCRNFQNGNFFRPPIAHPYFTESECNWYEPNNFVNQTILSEPEIFSFSMKPLSKFSFYCDSQLVIKFESYLSIINFELCF